MPTAIFRAGAKVPSPFAKEYRHGVRTQVGDCQVHFVITVEVCGDEAGGTYFSRKQGRRAQVSSAIAQQYGNALKSCNGNIILAITVKVANYSVKGRNSAGIKQARLPEAAIAIAQKHTDIAGRRSIRGPRRYYKIGDTIAVQITHRKVVRTTDGKIVAVADKVWQG